MKSSSFNFLVIFLILALWSCRQEADVVDHDLKIAYIEKNLLPQIIIEGRERGPMAIKDRMLHHRVPGISMAFFDQGKIQWTRTYGYLFADSTRAVDDETLFQAASISKPVAATAALVLIDRGQLDLDAPVNEYLKEWQIPQNRFTQQEAITVRHLVTHTGGLTVHGFRGYDASEDVPEVIKILSGGELANSDPIVADTLPGSIWRYSGGGYTVYQKALTDLTGRPFEEFLKTEILDKTGMKHSTYQQPLPDALHTNAAIGCRGDGTMVEGRWHTYPEQAAAGLWTTPSDLARFAIAIQLAYTGKDENLIKTETAQAMLTKHLGDWGLGFGLNGEADSLRFGHGGANEGYRCNLVAFANMGQGMAIMTNSDNGSKLVYEVLRAVSKAYEWNIYNPEVKQVIDLTDKEKVKLTGTYVLASDDTFTIDIDIEDGDLQVTQVWDDQSYTILPQDSLLFFDDEGVLFRFEMGDGVKVEKVVVNDEFELSRSVD